MLGASDIFLGANALDYSGYPDCRPEFIQSFQTMANLATRAGVEGRPELTIHTPLIALSKREIIEQGLALGVDYGITSDLLRPVAGRGGLRPMRGLSATAEGIPGGGDGGSSAVSDGSRER